MENKDEKSVENLHLKTFISILRKTRVFSFLQWRKSAITKGTSGYMHVYKTPDFVVTLIKSCIKKHINGQM